MDFSSCPSQIHKAILHLAYERNIQGEDLSFPEMLVTFFPCRPASIGPISVKGFSLGQLRYVCRKKEYEDFHFETDREKEAYRLNREFLFRAVADLIEMGWVQIIPHDQLIWDEYQPRVKSLEKSEMVRLTYQGEKFVSSKNKRCQFLPLNILNGESDNS